MSDLTDKTINQRRRGSTASSRPTSDKRAKETETEILRVLRGTGAQSVSEVVRRLKDHGFERQAQAVNNGLERLEALPVPLVRTDKDPSVFGLDGRRPQGRPPTFCNLSEHWGFVGAVEVGNLAIRAGVADINGVPVGKDETALNVRNAKPRDVLATAAWALRRAWRDAKRQKPGITIRHLKGIAVALPAPVNHVTNTVSSDVLRNDWQDVNIHDELVSNLPREFSAARILVANEADARALGEARYGCIRGVDNAFLVKVSSGIGGGAIHAGKLVVGASSSVAELGHLAVDPMRASAAPDGLKLKGFEVDPTCRCGGRNHVQSFASFEAIAKRLSLFDEEPAKQQQLYEQITSEWPSDEAYEWALRQACELVGRALRAACIMLGPDKIVISGRLAACDKAADWVGSGLRGMKPRSGPLPEVLLGSPEQPWMGVRGAARMAIEEFISRGDPPSALAGVQ